MKTSIKILFLAIIMAAISACSTQKRAERHIRRAVELCPEIMQLKTREIDTFISVPGYTDIARVPMSQVLESDAVSVGTDHGTVTLAFNKADSTLTVGFTSDQQEIHYQDTIQYTQVVAPPEEKKKGDSFWLGVVLWIIGIGVGINLARWLLKDALKN